MQSIQKIQKAIYTALNTRLCGELDTVSGVFHYIPQNTTFPYVHIGESDLEDISDFRNTILKIKTKIYVFDREKNNSTIMNLCEEVKNLLENGDNLDIEDHALLSNKFKTCDIVLENDGRTWKGRIEFEFLIRREGI